MFSMPKVYGIISKLHELTPQVRVTIVLRYPGSFLEAFRKFSGRKLTKCGHGSLGPIFIVWGGGDLCEVFGMLQVCGQNRRLHLAGTPRSAVGCMLICLI